MFKVLYNENTTNLTKENNNNDIAYLINISDDQILILKYCEKEAKLLLEL